MTFKELASKIAKREGLKSQTTVGNVREMLKITLQELSELKVTELVEMLKRYSKK